MPCASRPRPHPRHITLLLLPIPLAVAALAASPAAADVSYISQDRWIGATARLGSGFPDPHDVVASAPGFAPWSDQVEDSDAVVDGPFTYDLHGHASQSSTLGPAGIGWSGAVGGTGEYPFTGSGIGLGKSHLEVVFSVDEPTPYSLAGFIEQAPTFGFTSQVRLATTSGADVFFFSFAGPLESQGTLDPGEYRLIMSVTCGRTGPDTGAASSEYAVTLAIPAPAAAPALAILAAPLAARRRRR